MTDIRIPPTAASPPYHFPEDHLPRLNQNLKLLINELTHLINGMPDSHDEVEKTAKHLIAISKLIEPLEEHEPTGALHHILNQPLTIPGSPEPISLLQAALQFNKEEAYQSDLFKILSTFHEYPTTTTTLIAELELLSHELDTKNNRL